MFISLILGYESTFLMCVLIWASKQPSEKIRIIPILQVDKGTKAQRWSGFPEII